MPSAYQSSGNHLFININSFLQSHQSIKSVNMLCKPFLVPSLSSIPTFVLKAITGILQKSAVKIINHCKWDVTLACFP